MKKKKLVLSKKLYGIEPGIIFIGTQSECIKHRESNFEEKDFPYVSLKDVVEGDKVAKPDYSKMTAAEKADRIMKMSLDVKELSAELSEIQSSITKEESEEVIGLIKANPNYGEIEALISSFNG